MQSYSRSADTLSGGFSRPGPPRREEGPIPTGPTQANALPAGRRFRGLARMAVAVAVFALVALAARPAAAADGNSAISGGDKLGDWLHCVTVPNSFWSFGVFGAPLAIERYHNCITAKNLADEAQAEAVRWFEEKARLFAAEQPEDVFLPEELRRCRADVTEACVDIVMSRYAAEFLVGGPGDAYRHCVWAAWLTIRLGDNKARAQTTAHEISTTELARLLQGNSVTDETLNDLANNEIGHRVGDHLRRHHRDLTDGARKDQAAADCAALADNRTLRYKNKVP